MTTAVELAERGHQLAAWVNFNGTFNDASGQSGTYACSGSTITITNTAHGLNVGDSIHAVFTRSAGDTTTITDDFFTVLTVPSVDTFNIQTVVATTDQSGSVAYDSDAATATAGSGPIRASYNVASITYNGQGNYTVNFLTAMPDTNYVFLASASSNYTNSLTLLAGQDSNDTKSTTQIKFGTLYNNASSVSFDHSPNVNVAIFR